MPWTTIDQTNFTGADGLMAYVANTWVGFTPLTLFVFFLAIAISSFFAQKRFTGKGDLPSSTASASFATMVLAIIMTLVDGMINATTLTAVFVITMASVFWLLMSRDSSI